MMGLSEGRKSFPIGSAILIQYRSVTDTQPPSHPASQPPSHVAVAITLNAQASSLKSKQPNVNVLIPGSFIRGLNCPQLAGEEDFFFTKYRWNA